MLELLLKLIGAALNKIMGQLNGNLQVIGNFSVDPVESKTLRQLGSSLEKAGNNGRTIIARRVVGAFSEVEQRNPFTPPAGVPDAFKFVMRLGSAGYLLGASAVVVATLRGILADTPQQLESDWLPIQWGKNPLRKADPPRGRYRRAG